MFNQKSTETVTLTRPQLQAILEIISQMSGVNRSETWNDSKSRHYKTDNKLMFTDFSDNHSEERQSFKDNSQWVRHNDDLLATDLDNEVEHNGRASSNSLLMLSENPLHNQLLTPTSSNSSKGDDFRTDSVMTNDTSKESNFRRYARINDSEFDWNEYHRKQIKALEYSKALAEQHHNQQITKLEEQQRRKAEELSLEKRLADQRIKMQREYEREQKDIQEKRLSDEKKREAVIAAIERTPIIKKRNFLVESPTEPQPVAAIRPQTRANEMSTQTERQTSESPQYCETGTQTDVKLLIFLLNEMNLLSKEKSKSEETLSKNTVSSTKPNTTNLSKKYKSNFNVGGERVVLRRGVWNKKQNAKTSPKSDNKSISFKSNEKEENKEKVTQNMANNENITLKTKEEVIERNDKFDPIRRQCLINVSSVENTNDTNKKRVMSSIDVKTKQHFLPQISGRPHSRKKWYSQQTFDPTFLQ